MVGSGLHPVGFYMGMTFDREILVHVQLLYVIFQVCKGSLIVRGLSRRSPQAGPALVVSYCSRDLAGYVRTRGSHWYDVMNSSSRNLSPVCARRGLPKDKGFDGTCTVQ